MGVGGSPVSLRARVLYCVSALALSLRPKFECSIEPSSPHAPSLYSRASREGPRRRRLSTDSEGGASKIECRIEI